MSKLAHFQFEGRLNDFLSDEKKGKPVEYLFFGKPSIKDAVEAQGIPHVEVGQISSFGLAKSINEILSEGDQILVNPSHYVASETGYRFLADSHLGKLVKELRLLGFDTSYLVEANEKEIITRAIQENRFLLSRSISILKHKALRLGYWIRSEEPRKQISDVVKKFGLKPYFRPFSRCLNCNSPIMPVPKSEVEDRLPEITKLVFNEFFQCTGCKKTYWKGSHYDRMQNFIQQVE